jgi:hypothetical protein
MHIFNKQILKISKNQKITSMLFNIYNPNHYVRVNDLLISNINISDYDLEVNPCLIDNNYNIATNSCLNDIPDYDLEVNPCLINKT